MKKILIINLAVLIALFSIAFAGDLEPGAAPAPTMKTLGQLPPTWSQGLQCDAQACSRFEKVLFLSGVLDKETGLVWQSWPQLPPMAWGNAMDSCYVDSTGSRGGWRLPTIAELMSLMEGPGYDRGLPIGHPFSYIHSENSSYYWTSTVTGDSVYIVSFNRTPVNQITFVPKTQVHYIWCVRDGGGR
jgi:hypothetical protein